MHPSSATPAFVERQPAARATTGRDGYFTHHGLWAPGIRLFRRLSFAQKALLISLAFALPLLALLGWQLRTQYQQARQDRMAAIRGHVEIAHGILSNAYAEETAGRMSREQAQTFAKTAISRLRYDGVEYFWINDLVPRMVMHPIKQELDGKDISNLKDPNGLALFVAMADLVKKQGEGFIAYLWPKPGSEQPVEKISFVKGFAPWGWLVGSGLYVGDLHDTFARHAGFTSATVGLTLALAAYLFLSFYKVIDGGLKETRRHLRAMTEGDLRTSPAPWGSDEAAQLMRELFTMQQSLRSMVARVIASSASMVASSSEVATGAAQLSSHTERTAAHLQHSAVAMKDISATVKTTSDHTLEAADVASRNARDAGSGGRAMEEVIGTMQSIQASSARIGEITGTIDGIAFQTNILALNAAVEAARAGAEGRGFAVVASEVRSLAQRSAEAAKQIKGLIGTSSGQIASGTVVVQQAGASIRDIVDSARQVSGLLSEISVGAKNQSSGLGRIGDVVQELDRMTQQNAALVEQTAAASATMKKQAELLAQEVSRFKLPR